ncbi:unnamed protein product [Chondrus crispus]|uniref:Uncharacterized protein n=1 Tax=Chondrus crispus TaxID=2769 RepID=R7QNN5_CHOCR|nr:unnamed protein product [Chondrus crispus]CDF39719.1 unnamed protein product [Chondrus crispus]|eukprot:XP_005710013.1 unnamed protein product [Chondrus crispus]
MLGRCWETWAAAGAGGSSSCCRLGGEIRARLDASRGHVVQVRLVAHV